MKESFSAMMKRLNDIPDDELADLEKHLKTYKEKIARLCLTKPAVKGSYTLLTYYYWRNYCHIHINAETFEKIMAAPSPDSLGRILRFLNKDAKGTEWESKINPSFRKSHKRRIRESHFHNMAQRGLI